MRVIRLHDPNDLRLDDEPELEPGPGKALVSGLIRGDEHEYPKSN